MQNYAKERIICMGLPFVSGGFNKEALLGLGMSVAKFTDVVNFINVAKSKVASTC